MVHTSQFMSILFWVGDEANVPDEVNDAATLNESQLKLNHDAWGQPQANFSIVINLSFCGDWAGNVYPSTYLSTCIDHVRNAPAGFKDASWDITSLIILSPTSSEP
ncbi:hypothetical protein M407DRAFT_25873 [Tulasnella calospora MUT 4182]|uniref:Glycoside hydrolase family 16 protein n=1 Tax=Tulasnella calospora MUT 4182 TaxID=1051891 RepID=A0A0C3QGP0_9AGAM|nr:hypothetical protein M407DRAFT_25873 [Tulasnella calospora MUT 4182]